MERDIESERKVVDEGRDRERKREGGRRDKE
jgi:hypothetical protein